MPDHIRYDLLTQKALRGVVREVLTDVAKKKQLPGEHHFYISFDTQAEGVEISSRLLAQYPEEMTVILQHQFWDLKVDEDGFEVGLSFGGVPERLVVPYVAINGFFDPSVQFGLQFEDVKEGGQDNNRPAASIEVPASVKGAITKPTEPKVARPASQRPKGPAEAAAGQKPAETVKPDAEAKAAKPAGAEVVRLDRFRKK